MKDIFTSKTIIINALIAAGIAAWNVIAPQVTIALGPEWTAIGVAAVNIVLRRFTKEPLQFVKRAPWN